MAIGDITIDAASANLVESKSLKLYLNSFAMTRFPDDAAVSEQMITDLSRIADGEVGVLLLGPERWQEYAVTALAGDCIDALDVEPDYADVDPGLLVTGQARVDNRALHSHLLRSLCPVTAQPDMGSLVIRYSGPEIDPASLKRYLLSYREHSGFHEACVEQMFVDLSHHCRSEMLTVQALYNRRGGLDINPFRSNFENPPRATRLARQ